MSGFITPGVGSIGAAGLSLVGGMLQNTANKKAAARQMQFQAAQAELERQFNAQQAEAARQFNAQQAGVNRDWETQMAQTQRDWEGNMSNTAYQRAMADMRQAGLNPILAADRGGASTPQVSAPTAGAASGPAASQSGAPGGASFRSENVLGSAAHAALGAAQTIAGVKEAAQRIEQSGAMTGFLKADQERATAQAAEASQNTALKAAETQRTLSELPHIEPVRRAQTSSYQAGAAASTAAAELSREQVVTEAQRRRLFSAQGDEHSAGAVLRHQQAATESYHTEQTRQHLQRFGRTGDSILGNTADSAWGVGQRIGEGAQSAVDYILNLGRR